VVLRTAADQEAESAADVPGGVVARLEIAENVQLVGSALQADRPARLRAEGKRHALHFAMFAALKTKVTSSPG
jgi:hypothetical protein